MTTSGRKEATGEKNEKNTRWSKKEKTAMWERKIATRDSTCSIAPTGINTICASWWVEKTHIGKMKNPINKNPTTGSRTNFCQKIPRNAGTQKDVKRIQETEENIVNLNSQKTYINFQNLPCQSYKWRLVQEIDFQWSSQGFITIL